MQELQKTWQQIEWYLREGISLIPVRDKDDGLKLAKTPYGATWAQYQKEIVSKEELWHLMDEKHNTTAVGVVGGRVSGNLEIIDVDVKYKPGIDAILFKDLETLYPDIFSVLRIHKTPSGGCHMLYRCEEEVEGNQKLAGREKSEEELKEQPKPRVVNFIETRGEGGYVVAPPAMGYSVLFERPVPVLTAAQRHSLLALCRSYSLIIKQEKPYTPTKYDNDYYDENPFTDYNNRVDPVELMRELGWEVFTQRPSNNFIWFTRPGKKHGVSMSFNLQRRFFFCFTASTELEESHGYTPAVLVSTLLHAGDRKKTYRYLVAAGYGKIKPQVEEKLVKKLTTNRAPLPANASPEAKEVYKAQADKLATAHPWGTFWQDDAEKGITINRENLYTVADGLGFKLHQGALVHVVEQLIYEREERFFFDALKAYIKEEDGELYNRIANSFEAFIERHGKFTITRLQILDAEDILVDSRRVCYKFYRNGMLRITEDGYTLAAVPPASLVWAKAIKDRDFVESEGGRYVDFLNKAVGLTPYLLQMLGYLAHEYKDETTGYIVVLSEECQNPKDGGGSGKNIFSSLLGKITSYISKPGSQVKYDERFMQTWKNEKVYCLSDVPKNFDFSFLKELSAGVAVMKKLFVDEYVVDSADMPKFIISTNFSYEVKDGGIRRRVRPLEFTNFFTLVGGVDKYYDGVHFPNDWEPEDWGGFDTTMALGVQAWLGANRKLMEPDMTQGGWHKQFEQSYGRVTHELISENIEEWVRRGFVSTEDFKTSCMAYFNENGVAQKYQPSSYNLNDALGEYCRKNGIIFNKAATQATMGGIKDRGRSFTVPGGSVAKGNGAGSDDEAPF